MGKNFATREIRNLSNSKTAIFKKPPYLKNTVERYP